MHLYLAIWTKDKCIKASKKTFCKDGFEMWVAFQGDLQDFFSPSPAERFISRRWNIAIQKHGCWDKSLIGFLPSLFCSVKRGVDNRLKHYSKRDHSSWLTSFSSKANLRNPLLCAHSRLHATTDSIFSCTLQFCMQLFINQVTEIIRIIKK